MIRGYLLTMCAATVWLGSSEKSILSVAKHRWDPKSDPLPPLQPKEMGQMVTAKAHYVYADNGAVQSDAFAVGYQFNSYAQRVVQVSSGGYGQSQLTRGPVMQYSFGNYSDPSDPRATMLAQFQDQQCTYAHTEGEAGYQGYDFYRNLLQQYYDSGVPIYFSAGNVSDYGPCLVYEAVAPPLPPPAPPRHLAYTLTFVQSSGHLVLYRINGTEYCCDDGACVDTSPTCRDGTPARKTIADSWNEYTNPHIFENASVWDGGILGAYCPFCGENGKGRPHEHNQFSHHDLVAYCCAAAAGSFVLGMLVVLAVVHCRRKGGDRDRDRDGLGGREPLIQSH